MTSRRQQQARPAPRLTLVTPVIEDANRFAKDLAAALAAADVAAVLLRLADGGERALIDRIKALVPIVQKADTALLLDGHPNLVVRSGADGAHLTGIDAFNDAAPGLKPERIAGAGGMATRHDAMRAAEGGADYVMFGEPDANGHRPSFEAVIERVSWWAEVFQIPGVGFAAQPDEIAPLVAAGVDFVALGDFIFGDPRGLAAAIAAAAQHLSVPEPAA
jgi:thiamine-phosphate pyrophosphorylase